MMRKLAAPLLLTVTAVATAGCAPAVSAPKARRGGDALPDPGRGQRWALVFEDQFDRIDPAVWTVRGDAPRAGGMWLKQNVSTRNGQLLLTTGRQGTLMTTGAIDTRNKKTWRFGYFVMRAKLPRFPAGHRPAFWLQTPGTFTIGDEGRDGTEIDIMEAWSRNGTIEHNLHWDAPRQGKIPKSVGVKAKRQITYNEWHTFALWWSPDRYRFYVDGELTWETDAGGVSQVPEAILITDEALSSDRLKFFNAMVSDARSDPFAIDYVRVYQLQPAG